MTAMTVQELFDIAACHDTLIAHALSSACVAAARLLGIRLVPRPRPRSAMRGACPDEDVNRERLVSGNGDTAANHC